MFWWLEKPFLPSAPPHGEEGKNWQENRTKIKEHGKNKGEERGWISECKSDRKCLSSSGNEKEKGNFHWIYPSFAQIPTSPVAFSNCSISEGFLKMPRTQTSKEWFSCAALLLWVTLGILLLPSCSREFNLSLSMHNPNFNSSEKIEELRLPAGLLSLQWSQSQARIIIFTKT